MAFPSAVSQPPSREQGRPLLAAHGIDQVFGVVRALDGVDVELRAGEVLSLLGENGSGKSTLLSIFAGARQPTAGQIDVDGHPVRFSSPADALAHGITLVPQEHDLAPHLSVAENIWLGNLPAAVVNRRELEAAARRVLAEVLDIELDVRQPARDLRADDAMLVALCRACARRPRAILLDETTASLGVDGVRRFLAAVARLRDQGVAIALVTHRMEEHRVLSGRAVVLRDGRLIAERHLEDATDQELVNLMVGRALPEFISRPPTTPGPVRLVLRDVRLAPGCSPINLEVRGGEILGLGGMAGAGRSRLARIIAGAHHPAEGEIEVDGRKVRTGSVSEAIRHGIGFVPEDRKTMGLLMNMSVRANITLGCRSKVVKWGVVRRRAERALVRGLVDAVNIKAPSLEAPATMLSGGNQQKLIMARLLGAGSQILVLDEPTKGIDVGAKAEIFRLIGQAAADGCAVVFISSELPELLGLSHRIIVLRGGEAVDEVAGEAITEDRVVGAAMGVPQEEMETC